MESTIDFETLEELISFLEAEVSSITPENTEVKPVVFIGQMNEQDEESTFIRISVVVTSTDDEYLLRYIEPVSASRIPQESLKRDPEMEMVYEKMKKEYDTLMLQVEMKRKEITKILADSGFTTFKGVLT